MTVLGIMGLVLLWLSLAALIVFAVTWAVSRQPKNAAESVAAGVDRQPVTAQSKRESGVWRVESGVWRVESGRSNPETQP